MGSNPTGNLLAKPQIPLPSLVCLGQRHTCTVI